MSHESQYGERTKWFPSSIRPVRQGMYEIVREEGNFNMQWFSFWNGRVWGSRSDIMQEAFEFRAKPAYGGVVKWRGLKKEAK